MTDTPLDHPTPNLDADGRFDEGIAYLKCGYNLRGLDPENGRCLECGTAVGRSLHGNMLRFCDPVWVGHVASGMIWISAGVMVTDASISNQPPGACDVSLDNLSHGCAIRVARPLFFASQRPFMPISRPRQAILD